MEKVLFWKNPDDSVTIYETAKNLIVTLKPEVNKVYEQYFKTYATHSFEEGKDIWTFDKNNMYTINTIGQMIGNTNIKASYKVNDVPVASASSETTFILKPIYTSPNSQLTSKQIATRQKIKL